MAARDRIASVVLILAGLLTAAWTALNVWGALTWVPAGGGIGAVSSGLSVALVSWISIHTTGPCVVVTFPAWFA